MTDVVDRQTAAELTHWRLAVDALGDLDTVAAPEAWTSLESYLQRGVRSRLVGVVRSLQQEAVQLEHRAATGSAGGDVRSDVLRLRRRYLRAETVLDFFGDAVNSRTNPAMRDLLRGYDTLAADSMAATLAPVGIPAPPALTYVDKGLGAAILRAGVRLWDQGHPSPAAAIKLTRHNLSFPTALLHETGHQVAHLTGWNDELAAALDTAVRRHSPDAAEHWASWASELAADVHAFAQAGWAPVVALANVVDGTTRSVLRQRPGDPHPFAWIRVLFNVALCRSWFGAGPWDDVGATWRRRHDPARVGGPVAALAAASVAALDDVVDACTRQPMRAFGGRPISAVLDPRRVSPSALEALETQAGGALLTSSFLRRRDPLRVLAILATRPLSDPAAAAAHRARLRAWVRALGRESAPAPTAVA